MFGSNKIRKSFGKNATRMLSICLIGLILSFYATYVEIQAEKDATYEAMCDISEKVSCTKVFSSRYGKGFGLIGLVFGDDSPLNQPNGEIGIIFYILVGILGVNNNPILAKVQLVLCILSNLMSLYLAYLLYFILEDFCIVCVSTYVVNFACLLVSWQHNESLQIRKMTKDKDDDRKSK